MRGVDLILPPLDEGRVYRHEEVNDYIQVDPGSSGDYWGMTLHFPWRDSGPFKHDSKRYRLGEPVLLQFRVFSLIEFDAQLQGFERRFNEHDALRDQGRSIESLAWRPERDRDRVQKIMEKLESGESIFPVFVQQNDPQRRIVEGMHRAVAVRLLGGEKLPVFLAGYRDWF